jgi:predicted nuclease of predicted toxin-antitoxin system
MKFLADMGISPKTVLFLQTQGFDAVHLHEQELDRLPDSDILEKALKEDRILLTHDLDFGELLAASGAHLPSVIIFRLQNMKAARVNGYLQGIIFNYLDLLDHGAIITVTEGKTRIRVLPID